jgi:thiamine biosynthesis lipoprotein
MGTFFEADLRVPATQARAAQDWLRLARTEISRLERVYSRHDPNSELSRLNRFLAGANGAAHRLGPDLAMLLKAAQRLRVATGGAFDISIGPLVELWSEAARHGRQPSAEAFARARARVGLEGLEISNRGWLRATQRGRRLDLDAISKGAVLDQLRESFGERFPGAAALLSFGQSSVVAIGDPDGGGWRLVLRSRDPALGILGEIRLRDQALSMSSRLGQDREIGGRVVSHVLDPRTGQPVEGTLEAAVIAATARRADAWSTALLVLGAVPTGLERARSQQLEVLIIEQTGRIRRTPGWPQIEN